MTDDELTPLSRPDLASLAASAPAGTDLAAVVAWAQGLESALMYLAALSQRFPHVNTDAAGTATGLPDDAPQAWCLGCTAGETAQMFDLPVAAFVDDEGRTDQAAVAAAEVAYERTCEALLAAD